MITINRADHFMAEMIPPDNIPAFIEWVEFDVEEFTWVAIVDILVASGKFEIIIQHGLRYLREK